MATTINDRNATATDILIQIVLGDLSPEDIRDTLHPDDREAFDAIRYARPDDETIYGTAC